MLRLCRARLFPPPSLKRLAPFSYSGNIDHPLPLPRADPLAIPLARPLAAPRLPLLAVDDDDDAAAAPPRLILFAETAGVENLEDALDETGGCSTNESVVITVASISGISRCPSEFVSKALSAEARMRRNDSVIGAYI